MCSKEGLARGKTDCNISLELNAGGVL